MFFRERLSSSEQISELAQLFETHFMQRQDVYAKQLKDGRYVCVQQPLQTKHIIAHLQGKMTLGAYLLDKESRARFLVLDADDDEEWRILIDIAHHLTKQDTTTYLEQSRRGGHLWLFFEQAIAGEKVRRLGQGILAEWGKGSIELYPKQDKLTGSVGSLIRLPFGIHRRSGKRYGFIDIQSQPLAPTMAQQIQMLTQPETATKPLFDRFAKHAPTPPQKPYFEPKDSARGTVSERIKSAVSVREFVGQYVDLSAKGVGPCPFHDDQIASFSIHDEGNYWHCFACNKGGSIIDFWMMYRQCDFKQALRELARMLLK